MHPSEYDGFYFLPTDDDDDEGLKFAYFNFKDEMAGGVKEGHTSVGDFYHIAMFRKGEDGYPELDDNFEAIFADPTVYVEGLVGSGLYGCVVRKTDKSGKWWEDYLKKALGSVMILKMKSYAEAISKI